MLAVIGGTTVGLVWGWLIGGRKCGDTNVFATALILSMATFVFTAEVFLLTDWLCVSVFLAATLLALGLRFYWSSSLQSRLSTNCLP